MSECVSLQDQIAQRKKQAEERDIHIKAWAVARYLGSHTSLNHNNTSGDRYDFEGFGLKIECSSGEVSGSDGSMGFSGLDVHCEGNLVFKQGGGTLSTYVPGKWEEVLDTLQPKASEKRLLLEKQEKQNEEMRQKAKEDEERKKWGL